MRVTWHVSKQRMLQPLRHHITADSEPWGNLGWRQDVPHLAVSQPPSMGHPEETQEEKGRILAPDS